MMQLLFLVISILLYFLDIYILTRRGISSLKDHDIRQNLEIEKNDSVILGFILGLLIMPAASTILISAAIYFIGVLYQICYLTWFIPSGSRIAIPLMKQILILINSFFSIDFALGRITRMMIGFFWMIIGLSIFRYQTPRNYNSFNSKINGYTNLNQNNFTEEEAFIKNYAVSFLLLFDPLISISAIYYLRFVALPFF
jgi:hypothetical protein